MQAPRNGPPQRGGYRGRGTRGGFNRGAPRRSDLPSVPSKSQVIPGAGVSIVLKADQPTGREVQGTVQDVLTSGDHPRGIKVRMTDGRVGRVQRMASVAQTTPSQIGGAVAGTGEMQVVTNAAAQTNGRQPQLRYRDMRLDDEPEAPPANYDLSAFIKTAKPKKGKAVKAKSAENSPEPADLSCPVCGSFKGDETAVAHHVESHFT